MIYQGLRAVFAYSLIVAVLTSYCSLSSPLLIQSLKDLFFILNFLFFCRLDEKKLKKGIVEKQRIYVCVTKMAVKDRNPLTGVPKIRNVIFDKLKAFWSRQGEDPFL